jgi:hypothetical protein
MSLRVRVRVFSPHGRIASEELDLPLKGKIDFVSQGMNLIPPRNPLHLRHDDVELTQSQKINVKTSETKPVESRGE